MSPAIRLPLGTDPVRIDVPQGSQAALWASIPFAVDQGSHFRPEVCSLHSERFNHAVSGSRLSIRALNDGRRGFVDCTFRYRTLKPVATDQPTGEHTHV